jgi:hypothetical protein
LPVKNERNETARRPCGDTAMNGSCSWALPATFEKGSSEIGATSPPSTGEPASTPGFMPASPSDEASVLEQPRPTRGSARRRRERVVFMARALVPLDRAARCALLAVR